MTLVLSLLVFGSVAVPQQGRPSQELIPTYKNLSVYALFEPLGKFRDSEYITLDEGLKEGSVTISEKGDGEPPIQRNMPRSPEAVGRPAQQAQVGAEVNTLWLTNRSGRKLVILSGEMVRGGQQDRIIGKDTIIPSTGKPVDLGVFCVEQGRWSGSGKFASGGGAAAMAAPRVRAPAQVSQDQQKVWGGVASVQRAAGVSSSSGAYNALSEDRGVRATVEEYVANIQKSFPDGAVGVAVAVNGKLVWVDRFSSDAMFQKYWSKLLHSYAMEALAHRERMKFSIPTWKEAMAFASDRSGTTSYEVSEFNAKLIKTEGRNHVIFRLQDLSSKGTADVHESKVVKSIDEAVMTPRMERRLPGRRS